MFTIPWGIGACPGICHAFPQPGQKTAIVRATPGSDSQNVVLQSEQHIFWHPCS